MGDDGGKCDDIDTSTSNACDIIPGFEYEVSETCKEFGSYVLYYPEGAFYKDCSSPYVSQYFLPRYQDKCCGGEMNNKDICPNVAKPYEAFCTSESDFNADAPVFYECKGTDSEACKKAGGMYTSDDGGKCDDIDTSTSNACDIIPGFEYEVSSTCKEFGSYVLYYPEGAFYKDCSSPYVSQD